MAAAQPADIPAIWLHNIHLTLGNRKILDGVDLAVQPGEMVAVIGPSGAGKSTLLKIICGLLEPDQGEVRLQSKKIGLAFQGGALFTSLTVEDNLAYVLEKTTSLKPSQIARRVDESLRLVGLTAAKDKLPSELSGGMRKRVGIARALTIQPDIMLFDEPSAGLDPMLAQKLESDLNDILDRFQMTSVLVTHELKTIERLADRVALLYQGHLVYQGTKADFFSTSDSYAFQFRTGQEKGPIAVMGEVTNGTT